MARTEARIRCDIWDDEDFRSLTLEAQWLYHAILEQKDLSLCGVLTWTPKRFAKLAANASAATARKALELLRSQRYVLVDEDTDELWVRTLIKNDRVLDNHNSIVGMSNAFGAIHSKPIRDALIKGVLEGVGKGVLDTLPKGVQDRLAKPFTHALALAGARAPAHPPVPPSSSLLPPSSILPSVPDTPPPEHQPASQRTDDDEESTTKALIADRRMAAATKVIKNPTAYRARTLENVEYELGFKLRQLLAEGMTPEAVADELCPQPGPPPPKPYPEAGEYQPAFSEDDVTIDEHGRWVVKAS